MCEAPTPDPSPVDRGGGIWSAAVIGVQHNREKLDEVLVRAEKAWGSVLKSAFEGRWV